LKVGIKKGTILMKHKPMKQYLIMKATGGKSFTMRARSERQVKRRLGRKSLDYIIQEKGGNK